jgi:hypothetical protein
VIQNHLSQHDENGAFILQLLKESLYVDDFAGGADNDQEALDIYDKSQEVMKKGGFVLRNGIRIPRFYKIELRKIHCQTEHKRHQVQFSKMKERLIQNNIARK